MVIMKLNHKIKNTEIAVHTQQVNTNKCKPEFESNWEVKEDRWVF